jgi:hypothetical protein
MGHRLPVAISLGRALDQLTVFALLGSFTTEGLSLGWLTLSNTPMQLTFGNEGGLPSLGWPLAPNVAVAVGIGGVPDRS